MRMRTAKHVDSEAMQEVGLYKCAQVFEELEVEVSAVV